MVNFPRSPIDRAVHFVPSGDPTDKRVLTAEELALASEIGAVSLKKEGGLEFLDSPQIFIDNRLLFVKGILHSEVYTNQFLSVDFGIEVSSDWESVETKSEEYFYLMTLLAYVGTEQDPALGNFSRQFNGETITGSENTRRLRCFWMAVSSSTPLNKSQIQSAIALNPQPTDSHSPVGRIEVEVEESSNKAGFLLGNMRFYAVDDNLTRNTYIILNDSLELTPLCKVNHYREGHNTNGFSWSGASPYMPPEELSIMARTNKPDHPRDLLNRLMLGLPLLGKSKARAVLNAIIGSTNTGSTPHPGITSRSPNGSNIQANDQRIFYSNEARLQRNSVQHVVAFSNESSRPIVTATLNTENPAGSTFSTNKDDHRVYNQDGVLQNDFGSFADLGSDRSLSWIGNQNTTVQPRDPLIIAPGINFASGSGFSLPFDKVSSVYYNGMKLSDDNVRNGKGDDIDAYAIPEGGEDFIVVWGSERASLHYIYKKITITANSSGRAVVPSTELGCFAFIENVEGRIDEPVYSGLTSGQDYDCLVYYPPRSDGEIWQFEVEYTPYQGLGGDALFLLDGGTVVSQPINIIHSQGGGLSVHKPDSSFTQSAVAFHLPSTQSQYSSYRLNAPMQLHSEIYGGPQTLRELFMLHPNELTLPVIGQTIRRRIHGSHFSKSLNISLTTDDKLMGYRSPNFKNANAFFQSVCAFMVEKHGLQGLVVITHNEVGGKDLPFDVNLGAAIDVFGIEFLPPVQSA